MKEIKNKTIYTPDNVKKFLEVYYFEKVKDLGSTSRAKYI